MYVCGSSPRSSSKTARYGASLELLCAKYRIEYCTILCIVFVFLQRRCPPLLIGTILTETGPHTKPAPHVPCCTKRCVIQYTCVLRISIYLQHETGPIPDELSQLEGLEQLFLSDNELEGEKRTQIWPRNTALLHALAGIHHNQRGVARTWHLASPTPPPREHIKQWEFVHSTAATTRALSRLEF